ncbi:MAG: hypothetical protein DMG26_03965 [Acidobacteria bacterium]|nr:MAG: hypothetical protein DMG25_11440 [Acidobacteriota bacterium]PYV06059.1 MAG: hypothetical protein DMG26_03965 [Acidobacteriota bacterium]
MVSPLRVQGAAALFLIVFSSVPGPAPLAARHPDTEEDLQARIEREQNPVKKAKFEVRLGRVKLTQAIAAYDKGDLDRCNALAAAYLVEMKGAWQRLMGTGRSAEKKPEGFRELDIALREDARALDDLAHRIPYNDRGPVTEVAHEVDKLHGEVLAALFPPEAPSRSKKRSAPSGVTRLLGFPAFGIAVPPRGHGTISALAESRSLSLVATEATPVAFLQTKKSVLTNDEDDKLREEQDPAKRIELYLAFAQDRLDRFVNFRSKPADPNYDTGEYLDRLLGEYIAVDDELKDWIEYQYGRTGDMRAGLHALLERGPRQLEQLRQVQESPDAFAHDYASSLRDAIDDLTDTLDGASKALADQEKKFGELKREAKADARAAKEREKEEKKRTKEEKKLRKREQKRGNPTESDDD